MFPHLTLGAMGDRVASWIKKVLKIENMYHFGSKAIINECMIILPVAPSGWHSYTFTTWIAVDTTKNCRLQSWTLHKSADCRWISITILYVSFTNSATIRRLEQVQLCNRLIDQSADNITGLKCAKECLILKYKYIQNPWLHRDFDHRT